MQAVADAGVIKCPCCNKYYPVVGRSPSITGHWGHAARNDTMHARYDGNQPAGWLVKLVAECRDRASPGSPAHYHNHVSGARVPGRSASPPRDEVVAARHASWVQAQERRVAREQQRREQQERDEALGITGGRFGGARAEAWGYRRWTDAWPSFKDEGWAWLDAFEVRFLTCLDALTSRHAVPDLRHEYGEMLHMGLQYADTHATTAESLRGFKFIICAKIVTTGRLRDEVPRSVVEMRGRIRMVRAGCLEELFAELLRDATHHRIVAAADAATAEAEAARLAAEAEAETEELMETVRSAVEAAGLTSPAADGAGEAAEQPADTADGQALGQTLGLERKLLAVLRYCSAGYLSKGYSQFTVGSFADIGDPAVRGTLRALHPQVVPPTADELPSEAAVSAHFTTKAAFEKVFAAPPQERAMSIDAVSYEELQTLYHGDRMWKETLLRLVRKINAGAMHAAATEALGESLLVGIEKPDGGTRPIGIGGAIRRLAGRCVMHDSGERMGRVFTETRPTEAMLQAAGHGGRECNIPLQVGVGIKGGAEIAVAVVQLALQRHRDWAVFSDDKSNAFNTVTREAIYRGLKEWFPELIPAFRLFYSRSGKLFSVGKAGRQLATDEDGLPYFSTEGCTQGDPLGPFYWAVGYHFTLLEVQARHPDVTMLAFLDDTYYLQEPLKASRGWRPCGRVRRSRRRGRRSSPTWASRRSTAGRPAT